LQTTSVPLWSSQLTVAQPILAVLAHITWV
jgi:hypothetical protein